MFRLLNRAPEFYEILLNYEQTVSGLKNRGLLGAYCVSLGYCEYSFGDYDKSINSLSKGIRLCEEAGNIEVATVAYVALETVYNFIGSFDQVFKLKKEILHLLEQRSNVRLHAQTFIIAADAYIYLGRWQEALKECHKALDNAQEYSNDSLISLSTAVISMIHRLRGDQKQAMKFSRLAVEKAPQVEACQEEYSHPGDKADECAHLYDIRTVLEAHRPGARHQAVWKPKIANRRPGAIVNWGWTDVFPGGQGSTKPS